MKAKLFLCILFVFTLLLPATAQDDSATAQGEEGEFALNTEVSGDVEFWHFWGSPVRRTAIRRLVAECEARLPNVTITEVFKPWGDIWTANLAAVAAGSGMPEIIVADRPKLPSDASDGVYQSLQPYVDQSNIDPSVFYEDLWTQTLYEGETYGIPFETDVRVLYYNKTLFEQAGLDPNDPPETWDEVWEYADQLDVIAEDGDIQRIGFFPLIGNVGVDVWAQTNGYEWVQDGRPVVDAPEVTETYEWIRQWIERYGGWDEVAEFRSSFGAPPNDGFMSGRVAMFIDTAGYSSILNFYRPSIELDNGETPRIEWGVSLIPYNEEPSSFSGGFALSIPTGAENPEAAWEVIKCMTGQEAQVSWARDTYAMPTLRSAAEDPQLMADENWQFFVEAMDSSTAGQFVPEYPNWFGDTLNTLNEQIWRGEISVEDALQQSQSRIDDQLGN